ncbi:hypothetical protein DFH27DRAFT_83151 [Peziza echinospora]|nr:hypothetical protein DFH27DRAFT_83151 [Peziza echinospora]
MSTRSPSGPRDIRQAQRSPSGDYQGVNTLLQAALASSSSTSESYPEHEESRGGPSGMREMSSSSSPSPSRIERYSGPRPPRPTYTQEQEDAIRFHRDDLSMTWTQVEEAYNGLYYADGTPWERRTISGLQSRYYRLLPIPVNETKKQAKPRPELGILVKAPERRYWWMSTSGMTAEERSMNSQYTPSDRGDYSGEGEDYGDDEDDEVDTNSQAPRSQDTQQVNSSTKNNKRKRTQAPLPLVTEARMGAKRPRKGGKFAMDAITIEQAADHKSDIIIQVTPASTYTINQSNERSVELNQGKTTATTPPTSQSGPAGGLHVIDQPIKQRAKRQKINNRSSHDTKVTHGQT